MHQSKLAFNAGEVTPYLRHRMDIDKADSACELLENCIAMPYGGVIKRPGLRWLLNLGTATQNARLFPFIASDGTRYLLHFKPGTLTIYNTAGTVKDTCNFMTGYTWPGSFDWENSIRDLHMVQVNDVAFFTHPGTFPLRLSRNSDTDWTLAFLPFTRPPLLDENLDETKTFTVASNPVAATWADGASYAVNAKVFTDSEWICIAAHTANAAKKPGTGADWRSYWRQMFYKAGDAVTILCDDRSEVAWESYAPASYEVGQAFTYSGGSAGAVYVCLVDHATDDTSPGIAGVNPGIDPNDDNSQELPTSEPWLQASEWNSTFGTYTTGFTVNHNDVVYECIDDHASSNPDYEPGVGVDWATKWSVYLDLTPLLPLAEWSEGTGTAYTDGDQYSYNGRVFECILTHDTSNPATRDNTEPGTGVDWEDYWVEVSRIVESFSGSAFSPGQYFMIAPNRPAKDFQVEVAATGSGTSGQIVVQGSWNFFTYGTWFGTYELQRSTNGGITWETHRSWEAKGDRNIADSGTEDEPVIMRLVFTVAAGAYANSPRGLLVPENAAVRGYALMDTYVGPDSMTGFAKTSMLSGNTARWAYGAFNERDGYPRAIALHESRLAFAGTETKPVSLWLSATDDLDNFEIGAEADDGIAATLALSASSPIRWLASQRRLFIGTAFGEWACGSETSDQPLSPTNFLARQYSGYGSAPIAPHIAGDAVLFLERKASRLRDLAYDDSRGAYDAADLTRLAEHLTRGGVSCMAWQSNREPGLWVVRRDGVLLHFAWSRRENVSAWTRHSTTGGTFLDVAVLPSDAGDDEVFFIVQRGADMHLERFPQNWQAAIEDNSGWFHIDGTHGSGTTISIPAHLRTTGITRVIAPTTAPVVTTQDYTGLSTQAISSAVWQIGKKILSSLDSLPLDLQADSGTTQARRKRLRKVLLSLYNSRGGQVWNRTGTNKQTIPRIGTGVLDSGWAETIPDAGALDDLQLRIYHEDPFPFCLRSAVLRWEVNEA